MIQYCPDPNDSDLVFNLPPGDQQRVTATERLVSHKDEEPTSDDEAPEDVPFAQSKDTALAQRKAEAQSQKDVSELKKKHRQKTEALLLEQKQEKAQRLQALASKRLPESLLNEISSKPSRVLKQSKADKKKNLKFSGSHLRFESEHYVPIATEDASTDFQVAVLDTKKWKNKLCRPGSFTSKDFRQKALYKSNIRRVSVNSLHQARVKQATSGKFDLVGS